MLAFCLTLKNSSGASALANSQLTEQTLSVRVELVCRQCWPRWAQNRNARTRSVIGGKAAGLPSCIKWLDWGACTQRPRAATGKRNLNGSFTAMSLELGTSRPDPKETFAFHAGQRQVTQSMLKANDKVELMELCLLGLYVAKKAKAIIKE